MPPIYRDVLTLKYIEELANERIAETLGISHEKVEKLLERGLRTISRSLLNSEARQSQPASGRATPFGNLGEILQAIRQPRTGTEDN